MRSWQTGECGRIKLLRWSAPGCRYCVSTCAGTAARMVRQRVVRSRISPVGRRLLRDDLCRDLQNALFSQNKPGRMRLRLYDLAGAEPDRRFSPYCWRIRLVLAHKELAVETIPWRFTEKDEIAHRHELVPVLVDGDRWVANSWTIANYLEGTYPNSPSLFGGTSSRHLTRHYSSLLTR